jgi:protein TonB
MCHPRQDRPPPVASPPPLQRVLPPEPLPAPLAEAVPPLPAVAATEPPPPPAPPRHPPKQLPAKPHPITPTPAHRAVAARAPPPAPAPSSSPAEDPALTPPAAPPPIAVDWQRVLASWLAAHKTYPDQARRTGEQGSVVLRFTADRSGHVLNAERIDTGAPAVLGTAAEPMLRGAAVPPFPDTMPQERITITVRVRYALTD